MERIPRYESISNNELNRRWKAIREAMVKVGLDCLVMQNSHRALGGYVRYFTDVAAGSVVFPLDDELTVISRGPPRTVKQPLDGVKERIVLPYFSSFNFTNAMHTNAVVEVLKEQKVKSIGFVGKASMSASLYESIRENLPEADVHDATDLVDEIKAVKSKEEIKMINKTVELHDKVFEEILEFIRPGVMEYEIDSEIKRMASNLGSEDQAGSVGSAPAGMPASMKPKLFQSRKLKYGDQLFMLIEVSGPGGFYGEIARTVCIGVAPKSLLDLWHVAVETQDRTAELMKTGAKPRELLAAHNQLLTSMGYPTEQRLYSHGQGYDLVERPGIRLKETMEMKAGMFMAIHPETFVTKEANAFCCDNFLVTDSGSIRLNKTPREIFIV